MYRDSDKKGLLTIGKRDGRVTKTGYFLRKYKLDELPQFLNVLKGDMSIVGPRPEVRKYVDLYTEEQKKVLLLKPGITDYTSILFKKENEMLAAQGNPEEYYKNVILPEKLRICLNTDYSLKNYIIYIIRTII
jgi:lipopolysaccharide/colanic/teichoic acid biosynthesis glycosyltransferase